MKVPIVADPGATMGLLVTEAGTPKHFTQGRLPNIHKYTLKGFRRTATYSGFDTFTLVAQ